MALSALQRYILRECYLSRKSLIERPVFTKFYAKHVPLLESKPRSAPSSRPRGRSRRPHSVAASVTSSLERLIDRGLMIGFGRRTPQKWFIERVKLTPVGRRTARALLGTQQRLPLT